MGFDISTLSATETFDVEIMHPGTGEPLIGDNGKPVSVTVYGPGTKPFGTAKAAASTKSVERLRKRGKVSITAEEELASTASFLGACTVSFNNFDYKGMEGADGFRACYADPGMGWLTEQVNREMGDWANFTKGA